MKQWSCAFNELAKSFSGGRRKRRSEDAGREAAEVMMKEAKKNEMLLYSSGTVHGESSNTFVSVFSKRGQKGINQDCSIVWEKFGCEEDLMLCGVFDGHGPWGHFVAKSVRKSLPSSLLCNWQEALALSALASEKKICRFDIWKQSHTRSCATVDKELQHLHDLDSFHSGTTALTLVKQGDLLVIGNVGDSRAVLATREDGGGLVPVQLTVDFKPCLPQEAERIRQCRGRVFCLKDEPSVQRVWLPNGETPGLAMSRAFGDFCVKDFGLISIPEVTQRHITQGDQFIVLATDGVWDVVSNQEAIDIVASTADRGKSAKKLVECAVVAWKRKRRGIAVDDCSAVCLFFNSS